MSDWPTKDANPYASSAFALFAQRARTQLVPQLESSGSTAMLWHSGDPDIQMALELGLTLMMGKPLVLVVGPGEDVPDGLRRAAYAVVEGDLADEETRATLAAVVNEVMELGADG